MSWLTGFAGKAESFLNKLDQNAAVLVEAAAESEIFDISNLSPRRHQLENDKKVTNLSDERPVTKKSSSHSMTIKSISSSNSPNKQKSKVSEVSQTKKIDQRDSSKLQNAKQQEPHTTDDELIRFLNEPTLNKQEKNVTIIKCDETCSKESSEHISNISQEDNLNSVDEVKEDAIITIDQFDGGFESQSIEINVELDLNSQSQQRQIEEMRGTTKKQSEMQLNETEVVNLEENLDKKKFLDEISSLTDEMNRIESRAVAAEKECDSLRKMLEAKRNELRQRERRIQDYAEATETSVNKCKQLEEQVKELQISIRANEIQMDTMQKESKLKSEEIEVLKRNLTEQNQQQQNELQQKLQTLEDSMSALEVNNVQLKEELRQKSDKMFDLEVKLNGAKEDFNRLQQDHEDYKNKAKRVLMEKEKLLSSYNETGQAHSNGRLDAVQLKDQLEQALTERDLFRDEANQLNQRLSNFQNKFSETEMELTQQLMLDQAGRREAEQRMAEAKNKAVRVEAELKNRENEVAYLQEELTKLRLDLATKLKEREDQIKLLRAKSVESETESDKFDTPSDDPSSNFESRISFLTETLLLKQSLLEAVTADKAALTIKVEKLEKDLSDLQVELQQNFDTDSDESFDRRQRHSTKPFRHSTLEKVSTRIGTMFRRYPEARIFVIVYMVCLHLWVFFVLFHSTSDLTLPPAK